MARGRKTPSIEDAGARGFAPRRGARCALALLAASAAAVAAAAAPSGTFEFAAPRQLSTVLGPSRGELLVDFPAERVARIVVRLDGEEIATLERPPWAFDWDAGDGARDHRLAATLYLVDGTQLRAAVQTSRLRINAVEEVDLVNIYPVVRSGGGYLSDLQKEDFRILERGVPQKILRFSTEPKPLRIAIVLDVSQSMGQGKETRRIDHARDAALGFLDVLRDGDEAMLVTFSDAVETVQEMTADRELLVQAVRRAEPRRGTALYDAIWRTAQALREHDGRRVLVLLSDGKDEAYSGLSPGSLHTLGEALDQAVRGEAMVFAVGLGRGLKEELDFDRRHTIAAILEQIAVTTGGRALLTPRASQLRQAFEAVARDLRNQYSIAYSPPPAAAEDEWREIEVLVPGRRAEVICRSGYFASPPPSPRAVR